MGVASLYERLGGEKAVEAAVDIFYEKVLSDRLLAPFFEKTDMQRQKKMQKLFLIMAFGGPSRYSGRSMRVAHKRARANGLDQEHFDAVVGHLADTLSGLGVGDEDIAEVAKVADSVRADILDL